MVIDLLYHCLVAIFFCCSCLLILSFIYLFFCMSIFYWKSIPYHAQICFHFSSAVIWILPGRGGHKQSKQIVSADVFAFIAVFLCNNSNGHTRTPIDFIRAGNVELESKLDYGNITKRRKWRKKRRKEH